MDNSRDTRNTAEIAKFVESQSVRTNPFGENRVGERAYRRAERIAAAVVLLTNHVAEREPLRMSARTQASSLLSHVLALRDEMRAVNSEKVRNLRSAIRELISIIRLLAISGYVSFQNAGIVAESLDELSGFLIASQRSDLSEAASFSREDFLDAREREPNIARLSQRHVSHSSDMPIMPESLVKDDKGHAIHAPEAVPMQHKGHADSVLREMRVRAITEVLRTGGELGIRDIASNLPEYSEKMIQRELAQMAAGGVIRKAGSKRWSTYALAS